jgi:phage tail sheath protein FI
MPVSPTYPGVYIEEIPSGVRTIVGVATNIAAFVGRAVSGPVAEATTIESFADFERIFGGLSLDFPMSYSVNDFFQNGGSQAIIVRLFKPTSAAAPGVAQLTATGTVALPLVASSPGTWGNALVATTDTDQITDEIAQLYGFKDQKTGQLFNLTIKETVNGQILSQERFLNLVSVQKDAKGNPIPLPGAAQSQLVDRVLAQSSQLALVAPPPAAPAAGPAPGPAPAPAPAPAAPPPGDDGQLLDPKTSTDFTGDPVQKTGIYALDTVDLFNILCIPPDTRSGDTPPKAFSDALSYCQTRRAMLIVDSPKAWSANPASAANNAKTGFLNGDLGLTGLAARNAALYFPRVEEPDPLLQGQTDTFVPCGIVAGVMARTDVQRGVWKAPAGIDASLAGISGLEVNLTNDENGLLNPLGINCLRTFPIVGSVLWGARTLRGADQLADDYKYVPVRRLALFMEESLYRGTQWVVFEPNDEPLWSQIRLNVGAFMHDLFVQGAFQGQTPTDAYFVKCDKTTTTQNDINLGIVNIVVGFAPLKPAEFVILQIQQIAGNILT